MGLPFKQVAQPKQWSLRSPSRSAGGHAAAGLSEMEHIGGKTADAECHDGRFGSERLPRMRMLTVLGSTGSIGTNTLDVVRRNLDQYGVYALVAGQNVDTRSEERR